VDPGAGEAQQAVTARIKTGFRRLGAVGFVPCEIGSGCSFLAAGYFLLAQNLEHATRWGVGAIVLLGIGGAWWLACWALGWVIAGFVGGADAKP